MSNFERDSQRSKVFDAVKTADSLIGKPLADMGAVRSFVVKVQSKATLKRRYDRSMMNFTIQDGRGVRWTHGDRDGITVPTTQRSTIYVLRAMAYTIAARHRSRFVQGGTRSSELINRRLAWNGWEYCAILVDLVRYGLGESEAEVLVSEFEKRKIKWKKPRSRTLDEEQKTKAKRRGKALAAQNRDRKRRLEYIELNPDAVLKNADEFEDEYWETLYRVWR